MKVCLAVLVGVVAVGGTDEIVFTTDGIEFATVGIPLPEVRIELRDTAGERATGHGEVFIDAVSVPASDLVGSRVQVIDGIARFTSLMFAEQVVDPVLRFRATTSLPYGVQDKTLTTTAITLSPLLVDAYAVRFLVPPPPTVEHGVPFTVVIEAVTSAHQPTTTPTGGTVTVSSPSPLSGTTASFVSGAATLSLSVDAFTQQPVALTFTVQTPSQPRLNLKTLTSIVQVTANIKHRLAFDTASPWSLAGDTVPIRHDTVNTPPAAVAVLTSDGSVSTAAEGVVTATATSGDMLPLDVFGGTEQLVNGKATFSSLKVTGYYEGLGDIQYTFTYDTLAPLKTGLNSLTVGAASLKFLPTNQVFSDEGQTAVITQGSALPAFTVQVLDTKGNVDSTPDLVIDALLNDSTVLATVPVTGGSASFTSLDLGDTAINSFLTFKARSLSSSPLVVSRGVKLATGTITVHPLASHIAFGEFSTGSHVTAEGQTFTVNQDGVIPDILVLLYDGSNTVDTTTDASVMVAGTSGALQAPPGGTQVQFVNGVATFTGLSFSDVPADAKLVFTVSTVGLPATGSSISTGVVTVRGKPHHLARYLPYPTGAVLGVPTELLVAVVDENGTPVDALAFSPPALSLGGTGITPGMWTDEMITPIRFTLDAPLQPGDTARLTVTPTLAGTTFTPPTLDIQLSVSNISNSVDHASFLDPYSVPTVVRLREPLSVRVGVLDTASSPAVDGDAAYVVVSESAGNGVTMLPYGRMVGGVQTVAFEFTGAARDTTAMFSTILQGASVPDLTRAYKVLPGVPHSIVVTDISNQLSVTSAYPTVAAGSTVDVSYNVHDQDGNVVTEVLDVSATGEGVAHTQSQPVAGGGKVTLQFAGTTSGKRDVLLTTTAPSMQVVQPFTVVAGAAHHIAVAVPPESVLGETISAVVTVHDEHGNLAREADTTDVLITTPQHTLQVVSPVSLTSASKLTARFALQGPAGPATISFTPSLAGVVFSPATATKDISLVALQHGLKFDKTFGPVREEGMSFTAVMGEAVSPPITVNVLDSSGALDMSTSKVLIRASVQGAAEQVLANTDASIVNGRAVFSSLMFTKVVSSSAQVTFTAVEDPPLQSATPIVAGQSITTGNVVLVRRADALRFKSTDSVFAYEGQTLTAIALVPLGKVVVVVTTSEGTVDTTVGGASVVMRATPSQGALTGAAVQVVEGVATFDRLAFTAYAVQPVITFSLEGIEASLPVHGKTVSTGVINVLRAPQSVRISVDPLVPSTYDPGYLVYGTTNQVPVDVYNTQGALSAVPSGMVVRAASTKTTTTAATPTGSRFTVGLQPFAVGPASVVFTPSTSFIQFAPPSLTKEYVICAGTVAAMVLDEGTPDELEQDTSATVTLHAVDSSGNRLSSTWSSGCHEAYKYTGLGPPYATDITATVAGAGLRLGDEASYNENGTVTVSLYAEQVSDTLATFHFNGAPVQSVSHAFSVVAAVPSRLSVDPSLTSAVSGDSVLYVVEVHSQGGRLITTADDTTIEVNGTGTLVGSQEPLSSGTALLNIRIAGPPRMQPVSFTPTRVGTEFASRTDVQVNVSYARHNEGVFHTQWYQLFPNFPFTTSTDFATALSEKLTVLSAGPQYCPMAEVCREMRASNVRVIPVEQWPVPPLGNATAFDALPSTRGYVVQLINIEQTQVERIEAALSNAHLVSFGLFPRLQHSDTPVKFLGYNVFGSPSGVPCTSIGNETSCVANNCKWNAPGCVQSCVVATTETACALLSHCDWNEIESLCYESTDPDGGLLDDPFGQDWWVLLLLGLLLLFMCCACALCYRLLVGSKQDDEEKSTSHPESVKRVDSVVIVPEEQPENPLGMWQQQQQAYGHARAPAEPIYENREQSYETQPHRQLTERERIEEAIKKVDGMIHYIDSNGPSHPVSPDAGYPPKAYSSYPPQDEAPRQPSASQAMYVQPTPVAASEAYPPAELYSVHDSYLEGVHEAELVPTESVLTVDGEGNVVQRSERHRQPVR